MKEDCKIQLWAGSVPAGFCLQMLFTNIVFATEMWRDSERSVPWRPRLTGSQRCWVSSEQQRGKTCRENRLGLERNEKSRTKRTSLSLTRTTMRTTFRTIPKTCPWAGMERYLGSDKRQSLGTHRGLIYDLQWEYFVKTDRVLYTGKISPPFYFARFALWLKGKFKTEIIEFCTKDYVTKLESGRISFRSL